jgi:hypothetical protein
MSEERYFLLVRQLSKSKLEDCESIIKLKWHNHTLFCWRQVFVYNTKNIAVSLFTAVLLFCKNRHHGRRKWRSHVGTVCYRKMVLLHTGMPVSLKESLLVIFTQQHDTNDRTSLIE